MKFKTEAGDQTQYLTHEFNDNTIRFIVTYSGHIHGQTLQKAAEMLVRRIVVLHSSFHVNVLGTKWIVNEEYAADDFTVIKKVSANVLDAAKEAALHAISYSDTVQIRCYLFYNESESALVFLVGHMCADGRDALYLLQKLIEIYHVLDAGGTGEEVLLKNGNRSIEQCCTDPDMLSIDLQKIKSENLNGIKSSYSYCTQEAGEPRLMECTIPANNIAFCRGLVEGSTVNDVILAAYFRAYVRQMHLTEDTPVGIATMMDLRKYISDGHSDGVTNLSAPLNIDLPEGIGTDYRHTLYKVVKQTSAAKNNHGAGLDLLLVLKKFYQLVPFPLAIHLGRKVYRDMSIGLTNLGGIKRSSLNLSGCQADTFIFAGPMKKKPALQLSASGMDKAVCLCIVSVCTSQDQVQLEELLRLTGAEIKNAQ